MNVKRKTSILFVLTLSASGLALANSLNPVLERAPVIDTQTDEQKSGVHEYQSDSTDEGNSGEMTKPQESVPAPTTPLVDPMKEVNTGKTETAETTDAIPAPLERKLVDDGDDKIVVGDKTYPIDKGVVIDVPIKSGVPLSVEELLASITPIEKKSNDQLSIPKDAKDVSFLDGQWQCEMGDLVSTNGQPIKNIFTFNKKGEGVSYVIEKGGRVFKASIKAKLNDGTLTINTSKFLGTGSAIGGYCSQFFKCRQKGQFASCSGTSNDPDCGFTSQTGKVGFKDVKFVRIGK